LQSGQDVPIMPTSLRDSQLLIWGGLLAVVGIVGIARAEELAGASIYFAKQQAVWASLALLTAMAAARMPLVWWRRSSGGLYLASLACLALAPFFPAVNGAHRWIRFGPIGMQPSELAKLTTILLLSRALANEAAPLRAVTVVKALIVPIVPVVLIFAEPNLGTATLIVSVAVAMLWTAGLARRQLLAGMIAAACVAALAWPHLSREQRSRVSALFEQSAPQQTTGDDGYQLAQAKQVRALGGWAGSLLSGDATDDRSAYRLPEARTDFIFSVLGERLGICGLIALLGLYCLMIRQGTEIALAATDPFAKLLATGVAALFAIETLVNVGMNVGLLPVVGLSLPLVSYGGSGMLVHGAALGLLWNVAECQRHEFSAQGSP
jgi:rod shape determining protein RodA